MAFKSILYEYSKINIIVFIFEKMRSYISQIISHCLICNLRIKNKDKPSVCRDKKCFLTYNDIKDEFSLPEIDTILVKKKI